MNTYRPTTRGERRKAHTYRASLVHTHNVTSKRDPGTLVSVRCARADCYRITSPDGSVRFGSARSYGR